MTRRIALAILFSAWAVVLVALVCTYLVTRQTLIAELDEAIIMRASALPQLSGVSQENTTTLPPGDRYVIRTDLGQVIVRPQERLSSRNTPVVSSRKFVSLSEGGRLRSITLSFALPASESQPQRQATIVYSAPASELDNLLRRMALVLGAVGIGGALLISAVAWQVSKAALRPLRQTADV